MMACQGTPSQIRQEKLKKSYFGCYDVIKFVYRVSDSHSARRTVKKQNVVATKHLATNCCCSYLFAEQTEESLRSWSNAHITHNNTHPLSCLILSYSCSVTCERKSTASSPPSSGVSVVKPSPATPKSSTIRQRPNSPTS